MKMNRIALALVASLLALAALPASTQEHTATIKGTITDGGKPLENAQVVLTNTDTGRKIKTKTDRRGDFAVVGLAYGNFKVEVLGANGEVLVTRDSEPFVQAINVVSLDLKNPSAGGAHAGGSGFDGRAEGPMGPANQPSGPKLTKEQLAKIEADNKKISGLNSLITEVQSARQAQDWPKAEKALKQLIAAAPDTSRWDFYMFLGEAQTKSNKFEEATQTYNKGIKLAQSLVSGSTPADPKIPTLNPATAKVGAGRMLTAQSNDYLQLQKPDLAIASLKKAAELDPTSAMASYNLCGVEFNAQKYDDARASCNKYLQLEPTGAQADEVKTFLSQMGPK